jgi:hypothetical protein
LARALDLHSRGQGFDSLILHALIERFGILVFRFRIWSLFSKDRIGDQGLKIGHQIRFFDILKGDTNER